MIQPQLGLRPGSGVALAKEHLASVLLVDVADQRWFDLQFEFMAFIIGVALVMLQTGSEGNQEPSVGYYFCKLHHVEFVH